MRPIHSACLVAAAFTLSTCAPVVRDPSVITSPDGMVAIRSALHNDGKLWISIRYRGQILIAPSPVGVEVADAPIGPLVQFARSQRPSADASGTAKCATQQLEVREASGARRTLRLETRACDEGAAFRLVIPAQPGFTTVRLYGETTRFNIPRDDHCLGVRHEKFLNSHEGDYAPLRLGSIAPGDLFDLPLTCMPGRGQQTYAITESRIENYSAAYLTGTADRGGVAIKLTPRPDNDALAVVAKIPAEGLATPWRVVMVADRPERMIENRLVDALAAPSRIGDRSWIEPGKAAWGWWSGLLAPDVPDAGHNMSTYRRYIDFAARLGLRYYVIDEGWAFDPKGKDTPADVLRPAAGIDIAELVRYAQARGVRLWLWADWKSLDGNMDGVFAQWQRWGVAGIKIDFIYRQDQDVVAFYHRVLATAAGRHLLVNLHAAFVPRGLAVTYPNFLTQEGAMGNEYNRWSRKVTAGYNVRAAYSRATIGPMDYTPGGFRNVTPAQFSPKAPAPQVMTTRAQQLALFVVYPSPLAVLADAPSAYRDEDGGWAPGVEFLREVPTVWEQTRGIGGTFGQWIAVARQHGNRWYVGAITDEHARSATLSLAFLGSGRWRVRAWLDGDTPAGLKRLAKTVDASTNLVVPLAANGGAALIFER